MLKNQSLLRVSFITEIVDKYSQELGSQSVSDMLIQGLEGFGFNANTQQGLITARNVFVNLPELTIKTSREIKDIFDSLIEDKYTFSEEQLLVQVYGERGPVSSLEDLIKKQHPDYFYPYSGNLINFNKLHSIQLFCDELILQRKFSFEKRTLLDTELNVAVFKDLPNMPTNNKGEQKFAMIDITNYSPDYEDGVSLNMLEGKTRLGDTDTTFIEQIDNLQKTHNLSILSLDNLKQLCGSLEGYYQTAYPKQTLNAGELANILFGLIGYTGDILLETHKNTDKKQWYFHSQGLTGSFGIANASKDKVLIDPFKNHKYRLIFSD